MEFMKNHIVFCVFSLGIFLVVIISAVFQALSLAMSDGRLYALVEINDGASVQSKSILIEWDEKNKEWNCYMPGFSKNNGSITITHEGSGLFLFDGSQIGSGNSISVDEAAPHRVHLNDHEGTLAIHYGSNIEAMFIDTASGNMDYINEEKGNREYASITLVDETGGVGIWQ